MGWKQVAGRRRRIVKWVVSLIESMSQSGMFVLFKSKDRIAATSVYGITTSNVTTSVVNQLTKLIEVELHVGSELFITALSAILRR